MKIVNPATEELIRDVNTDTLESLEKKFKSLRYGHIGWSKTELKERIKVLQEFSEVLKKNIEPLASVLTSEVGKPLQQSRNEINGACARVKWLTDNAEKFLSNEVMAQEGGLTESISYEPLGIVCNISAWNYPWLVGVNVFCARAVGGQRGLVQTIRTCYAHRIGNRKIVAPSGIARSCF